MLRIIFVMGLILIGIVASFHGAFYALMFYLWNAYFRPELWVWDPFLRRLSLSFTIGGFLLLVSLPSFRRFRLNLQVGLMLLFFLQSIISLIFSENIDYSFRYWMDFAQVVLIAMVITVVVADRRQYRIALLVIALSFGFETAKQGWAQMILNPGATNMNRHPMFGDNNGVAVGMMMLAPIFIALSQTASQTWERYLHRFFLIGVLYRGISTYSRGGFLAAAAMGLVAWFYSPRKIRSLVALLLIAGLIGSVMPQRWWDRMETITAAEEDRGSSEQGRLHFWGVALRMADEKPFTGVGFSGYTRSYLQYDPAAGELGRTRAVHSAWFGVLAEMGYPGLILIVALIANAYLSAIRIRRKASRDPSLSDLKAYAGALQMSLSAYVVGMTFLNGQYNEMLWHLLALGVVLDRLAEAPATATVAAPARTPRPVARVPAMAPSRLRSGHRVG